MSSRLVVDLSGGDQDPKERLKGVILAEKSLKRPLTLIGNIADLKSSRLGKRLSRSTEWVQATDTIEMTDSIRSLRAKPNSAIMMGCKIAGESYKAKNPSAFISAGHSGAMMAAALLQQGRLKHLERPAIVVTLPTILGRRVVLLDAGANTECEPTHLEQFALMGAQYAKFIRPKNYGPIRVGLLSNGEEPTKGNTLVKKTHALLDAQQFFQNSENNVVFMGNCEGKEMFRGEVDVVVTDGFTGNLVLKCAEGLETAIRDIIRIEATKRPLAIVGMFLASSVFKALKKHTDYRSVGAAPLLGVAGYTFIGHGRSDRHAILSALKRADEALDLRFIEEMESVLLHSAHPPFQTKESSS